MDHSITHITILSIPALGHLIPALEFAKRIVSFHGYNVTLLAVHTISQSKYLSSVAVPRGMEIVNIPPVDISEFVSDDTSVEAHVSIIIRESLPLIRSFIDEKCRKTVLVVDGFASIALDIVSDNICAKKYMFLPANAAVLAFTMYLPVFDREVEGEFTDLLEPIQVPGCTPIQIDDLIDPIKNRKDDAYRWFLYNASRFHLVSGIITNSCECLEPRSLEALRESQLLPGTPSPRVYPVGPLVQIGDDSDLGSNPDPPVNCITWLDMQPDDSVLYVSFGSGGTLSAEQVTELACGLELSQQRFIWVVRRPIDSTASGAFFDAGGEHNNCMDYLPDGFMTRTKGVGLVLPSWGPQRDILAHKATGGFVSHCGWNSTLESLVHGVVIIAWPLFAEQNMNARMLVEELGVAVRPEGVGRREIERVVRLVMEGKEENSLVLRERAREVKNGMWKTMDLKGGSSYNSLSQLLEEWKNSCGLEN